ncbi:MAG: FtsQ-type POTRA domain-containing protein [Clostridiales bacterium]|jgi:cell division septal protein FtsQ|nr:FtsQ-type POTRA domain-containing protein [Clostridiales bacterium]
MGLSLRYRITLIGCALAAGLLITVFSPYFLVTESDLVLVGNVHIERETVVESLGLSQPRNILLLNLTRAKQILNNNPHIESVSIQKRFPNIVRVSLDEIVLSGYVPYINSYLCVDRDGKVIKTADSIDEALPIIEGLEFSSFNTGQVLRTDNPEAFEVIVMLLKWFQKYEFADLFIKKIDVSELKDIHIHIYNVDVAIGSVSNGDEKLRTVKEIFFNLPDAETVKGVLDIREIKRSYIFKALT